MAGCEAAPANSTSGRAPPKYDGSGVVKCETRSSRRVRVDEANFAGADLCNARLSGANAARPQLVARCGMVRQCVHVCHVCITSDTNWSQTSGVAYRGDVHIPAVL